MSAQRYAMKSMILLTMKEGWNREDFASRYESGHVPLIVEHSGVTMTRYARNYVRHDLPSGAEQTQALDFDVVTEAAWTAQADWDDFMTRSDRSVMDYIAEDEDRFMDRTMIRFFLVDTRSSNEGLPQAEQPATKVFVLVAAQDGLSREEFTNGYEATVVPAVLKSLDGDLCSYERNYILNEVPSGGAKFGEHPGFDAIVELGFAQEGGWQELSAGDSLSALLTGGGEPTPVDLAQSRIIVVTEHSTPFTELKGRLVAR